MFAYARNLNWVIGKPLPPILIALKKTDKNHQHPFTLLDMKDFYRFIKENLMKNTNYFHAKHTNMNKNNLETMLHTQRFCYSIQINFGLKIQ